MCNTVDDDEDDDEYADGSDKNDDDDNDGCGLVDRQMEETGDGEVYRGKYLCRGNNWHFSNSNMYLFRLYIAFHGWTRTENVGSL